MPSRAPMLLFPQFTPLPPPPPGGTSDSPSSPHPCAASTWPSHISSTWPLFSTSACACACVPMRPTAAAYPPHSCSLSCSAVRQASPSQCSLTQQMSPLLLTCLASFTLQLALPTRIARQLHHAHICFQQQQQQHTIPSATVCPPSPPYCRRSCATTGSAQPPYSCVRCHLH